MSVHYFVVVSKKDNWMAHFSLVYSLTLSFESTFRFIIFFYFLWCILIYIIMLLFCLTVVLWSIGYS